MEKWTSNINKNNVHIVYKVGHFNLNISNSNHFSGTGNDKINSTSHRQRSFQLAQALRPKRTSALRWNQRTSRATTSIQAVSKMCENELETFLPNCVIANCTMAFYPHSTLPPLLQNLEKLCHFVKASGIFWGVFGLRLVQTDCIKCSKVGQFNTCVKRSQFDSSLSYCILPSELCRPERALICKTWNLPTLCSFLCYWSCFHCWKWPKNVGKN